MRIRKLGIVGAGAMGSGIAALAASAGVPVVLLDVPGDKDRGGPAAEGLKKSLKARPAAFMDDARAALVRTGNIADDLALFGDCDWVIEAIIEQPGPKKELFARLESVLKPTAVVSSNTSGIPMNVLTEGRTQRFKEHFLGTHFFNPPRYMHLLELIPTPDTAPAALDAVREFSEGVLGKGVVIAKDAPGFVANRLGVFGLVNTIRRMEEFGLTIDEVDALTGPLIGRPKSATFRTGDISGIDVLGHVTTGLSQATGENLGLSKWVQELVKNGQLGEKSGAGFYRKQGKEIQTLDWRTGQYAPQAKGEAPEIAALMRKPLAARMAAIRDLTGKYGDFLRASLVDSLQYALKLAPQLAYDAAAVDRAMEWGYGWEAGPFKMIDMLGADWLRGEIAKRGAEEPALLKRVNGKFYQEGAGGAPASALSLDGASSGYAPVPAIPRQIALASVARRPGAVLEQTDAAALLDIGDGVALLEFRSKANTMGEGVMRALQSAMARVERDGLAGLVVGNDDPRTFTAGADLTIVASQAAEQKWGALDQMVRDFQATTTSLRRAPFPTVVAPFGLTLGGGAELTLHASRVQAHAELYMGLVEVGVGLIPAGGGTKELLFRFTQELQPYDEADPFEAVKRAFGLIATARTSASALEARKLGFLRDCDRISMNRDRLISDAKQRVVDLAPDYVAPVPRTIRALGREGIGNLEYALWAFHEAGQASDHDVRIGREVAYVLCGGDGPPRDVTEQDVLDLEREAFLKLLGTKETQDRIAYMLKVGKPLRN
ncbi:MAG TPA: 3-hydroxyacyl-CoA dehydrogenase/enoyl-CoA hydratase family protein [Gemmatimonadaceae bacterium]|nr:3-hydroxyacyl-CoA dehydrogenase/enoyl-CoA hydratase family protein [Gemmatimonadaceae bacterium]